MQKIAIVGFGAMGQMHAKCYQAINKARIVAIVDAHPEYAQNFQEKLGMNYKVYPSLKDLFANEEVDVVDICLPTDMHVPVGLEAIAAGKHVFCEKPFAPSAEEGKKLVEAARRKKRYLMVGHCIRFWPEYQYLENVIKEKKFGKLLSLSMVRLGSRPLYSKGNWLQNTKRSGGAIMDLHIHDTDFAQHLFGLPQAVTSVGTKDYSGWAHVFTTYHYKNVAVTAEGGWNMPSKWGFKMGYRAVFEKGAVEYDINNTPSIRVTEENKAPKDVAVKVPKLKQSKAETGNISDLGGYYNELKYFVECLESGTAPKVSTGLHGMQAVSTIHAEIKSLESGKTVPIKK